MKKRSLKTGAVMLAFLAAMLGPACPVRATEDDALSETGEELTVEEPDPYADYEAYEGECLIYVSFSGDRAGGTPMLYLGPDSEENDPEIAAETAVAAVGDTVTVSLDLPVPISHTSEIFPVIVPADDDTEFAFLFADVSLKVDGTDTEIDAEAGEAAWPESVGGYEHSWKLCGGYEEEGTQYVSGGVFAGASNITYTITINDIYAVPAVPEPEPEPEPEIIPEPVPEELPVQEPVSDTPVITEGSRPDKGLVTGIIIAVIAVLMIIAGIILSRDKDAEGSGDEEDDDTDDDVIDLDDPNTSIESDDEPEEAKEQTGGEEDTADLDEDISRIGLAIEKGAYSDDWASLSGNTCPEWFADAKFGIFVHWGVFTSEEFANEWYPRNMYVKDSDEYRHHIEKYGPHTETGYKDYVDRFKPEKFDPDEWMDIFRKAGAEYVVPVGEHHDGFQMYKSRISHWNAFEKGPKRDIIAELKKSAEKKGLHFGVSSHRIEHWWFLGNGRGFDSDIKGEFKRGDLYWPSMPEPEDVHDFTYKPAPDEEFMKDWLSRVCEIVDRFHPEVIYFDWWIGHEALKPYLKKAAAYYYGSMAEKGLKGIIVSKSDAFAPGTSVRDIERGGLAEAASYVWESDTPICRSSWGYVKDASYKTAGEIVRELIDIVSKNGNLLLNVGPRADGSICDEEKEVLIGIGRWLSDNGEMIYKSRPYKVFGEGDTNRSEGGFKDDEVLDYTSSDFRFTVRDGNIYAAAMKPSEDGRYLIKSLAKNGEDGSSSYKGIISGVTVLGDGSKAEFEHTDKGLEIRCGYRPDDDMPVVFRIEPA